MCKGHERCSCGGPYPDEDEFKSIMEDFSKHSFMLPDIEMKITRIGWTDEELRIKAAELQDRIYYIDAESDTFRDKIYQFLIGMRGELDV